ncbi:MAG TPA: prefoldin subunit alpha [Thermoplasmata archaeon]|nr:prefoldin subunit alpha [Thermoplasmata archaeon]
MASPARRPEEDLEVKVQEDLARLEAYRNQLNALLQQHQILSASRQDHLRARESLEGIERTTPDSELLLPLGGETLVRGSIDRSSPVLIGVGSGVLVEMERPKASELLAQRMQQIDATLRDLEGQMNAIDERIQILSRRLESVARAAGGPSDVGGD